MAQKTHKTIPLMGDYTDLPSGLVMPEKLTMRPPRVKDERRAASMAPKPHDVEVYLIASLCEVQPEIIDELEMCDYVAVQGAYQFYNAGKHLLGRKRSETSASS